jgi:glyoxylase-like metal-dependent hydrolase (beta-lactamase superfamily II)
VAALTVRFCDEFDAGFGWVVDEFTERCSHALVVNGNVWLIDPVDAEGLEDRVRAAGKPVGVLQLLDRHNRDCAELARRLEVEHHVVPRDAIPPFEFVPIKDSRIWKEVALWWPDARLLVSAEALGTARYYRAGKDRLAVHPVLRAFPPRRQLDRLRPARILCGHGTGIQEDAETALREALSTSRRRIPGQVAFAVRSWRATRRPS